ncbi:MAG: hypothetical protein ACLFV2_04190 [Desulfurivibrionaceae bacterium]
MKTNSILLSLSLFFVLAACTTTSGIVPAGPGKYMISGGNPAIGASGAEIKNELYKKASDFCAEQGKVFEPLDTSSVDYRVFRGTANAELTFHCVAPVKND